MIYPRPALSPAERQVGASEYVNLGEGAGDYELVTRRAYNSAYDDLKAMLEEQGAAALLDYKRRCIRGEVSISPLRQTLVTSIVQERTGGVHLLAADEIG